MALFTSILVYLEKLGPGAGYLILLIASGFVFLCMAVFSLAAGDSCDGDFDTDALDHPHDAAGQSDDAPQTAESGNGMELFKYLSFRNCINYLLGFSFCGFLATQGGVQPFLSGLLALSGGFISAIIMYKLMTALYSLSDTQPLQMRDALGKMAKVYIQIGAKRTGRGKILLKVKGAQREFPAVTDNEEVLRAGATVRVTDVSGDGYVVEPVAEGATASAVDSSEEMV